MKNKESINQSLVALLMGMGNCNIQPIEKAVRLKVKEYKT